MNLETLDQKRTRKWVRQKKKKTVADEKETLLQVQRVKKKKEKVLKNFRTHS